MANLLFESVDGDLGTNGQPGSFGSLSPPTSSVNAQGYKVTTQTLTLYAGFPASDWVRMRVVFPGSVTSGAAWTVTATANSVDQNDANSGFVDLE